MEVTNPKSTSGQRSRLGFWQIWNMSFGFFGIQFGWALEIGNMSAIYKYLGAEPSQIPILWLAAPLTGLIVQPIIGNMSDNTWGRFGRRKPYLFIGAILSSIALFFMPTSAYLWMAVGLLWILDTSINISMEPFRALVADKLPKEQRTDGFAMQSFFIGLGAVLASILPYLLHVVWKIDEERSANAIPDSVRWSFFVGAIIFFAAVLYTVLRTKEYPPDDIDQFRKDKKENRSFARQGQSIVKGMLTMPVVMRQLAWVQFFSWMGLFVMWIYFTIAIPKTCFGNPPVGSHDYITATQWGSVCFGFYSLITFIFALKLLPAMARIFSRKITHIICLFCGGIGLISVWFIHNPYLLFLPMTGVGIAWASVLAIPYAILSTHIPPKKMGLFMGLFNFFIVLPELISTLLLGYVISRFLNNDAVLAVVIGGILLILAGIMMLRVQDKDA